jgi:hypothetical protein
MPDVNSATSGVMSSSGRDCKTFNRWRRYGVSRASFVEDKLRDVDLKITPALLPPFSSDPVGGRQ